MPPSTPVATFLKGTIRSNHLSLASSSKKNTREKANKIRSIRSSLFNCFLILTFTDNLQDLRFEQSSSKTMNGFMSRINYSKVDFLTQKNCIHVRMILNYLLVKTRREFCKFADFFQSFVQFLRYT